ncbi:MAG: acetyltransferase [Burkholderiales bacterium]|nr:acetyltransferase [Burkholderiales bacterium]
MPRYDVFNGDADGLCALQQLRLESPEENELVTGTKRDVRLLGRVPARAGDAITVLDISVDANREALARALAAGATVRWFDHHYAGEPVVAPNFEPHIDTSPEICTSLIVDRFLGGRRRAWAIAAAFGDNLVALATRLAREAGLGEAETAALRALGQSLNYNAYGDSVADLRYDPAALARRLRRYEDPFDFLRAEPVVKELQAGYAEDLANARRTQPTPVSPAARAWFLPQAPWARRVFGAFANALAAEQPAFAHAVLAPRPDGTWSVSLRAPAARPEGCDELARAFPTGGGRKAAAGIDRLPQPDVDRFLGAFGDRYGKP